MFAHFGLADVILEGGVFKRRRVDERMGAGLIHRPIIVSKQLVLVDGVLFKSQSF